MRGEIGIGDWDWGAWKRKKGVVHGGSKRLRWHMEDSVPGEKEGNVGEKCERVEKYLESREKCFYFRKRLI